MREIVREIFEYDALVAQYSARADLVTAVAIVQNHFRTTIRNHGLNVARAVCWACLENPQAADVPDERGMGWTFGVEHRGPCAVRD